MRYEAGQRWMSCWLTTDELDLLDSAGRGFCERLHPLISRDDPVTLTRPARRVAMGAFKLAVARYLKPHEMRVKRPMVGICYDRLHVAPLSLGLSVHRERRDLSAVAVRPQTAIDGRTEALATLIPRRERSVKEHSKPADPLRTDNFPVARSASGFTRA